PAPGRDDARLCVHEDPRDAEHRRAARPARRVEPRAERVDDDLALPHRGPRGGRDPRRPRRDGTDGVTAGWELALAGLLVGIVVGATGMGGGSLMTPILVIVFGFNPRVATGRDPFPGAR